MAARDRFCCTADGAEPGGGPGEQAGIPQSPGSAGTPPAAGLEVYGDPAYGSGEARAAYRDAGHDAVIKPGPLRPAVPGGFTIDDFTIDEQAGAVTCPAGITRPMTRTRTVTFGAACAGCPLRQRCTTAKDGRPMTIHPHEDLLRGRPCPGPHASVQAGLPHPAGHRADHLMDRHPELPPDPDCATSAPLITRLAAHPVRRDQTMRTLLRHGLARRDGAWVLA